MLGQDPETGLRRSSPRTAATGPTSPRCCPRTRAQGRQASRAPRSLFKSHDPRHDHARGRRAGCSRCRASSGADPEAGDEITAQNGRYGPYLKKGTDSRSLDHRGAALRRSPSSEALAIYAQPKQRGRAAADAAAARSSATTPSPGQPVVVKDGPLRRVRHRRRVQRDPAQGRHGRGDHPRAGRRAARRAPRQGPGEEGRRKKTREEGHEEDRREEDRREEDGHEEGEHGEEGLTW